MVLYDDKTKNAIKNGHQLLLPYVNNNDDITFKASFVIAADLKCSGKVTALFDLVVFGDVDAEEIDVKGRFICMGQCSVSGTIVAQNDIWGEDFQVNSIICHDRIIAQSIDAETVIADGNIIIGKTLAIEEKAQTSQKIICGETAYGAGKVEACSVLTAEPLDLDDGEEALESPFQYIPQSGIINAHIIPDDWKKYLKNNDYINYISKMKKNASEEEKTVLDHYLQILKVVDRIFVNSISDLKDLAILIGVLEIKNSNYFTGWNKIEEWIDNVIKHFKDMVEGKVDGFHDPQPAKKLEQGYTIIHKKFGTGIVKAIVRSFSNGKPSKTAVVEFEIHGEKKFPLPDSLKFFSVISEGDGPSVSEVRDSIQCNIESYLEWLISLQLIEQYKESLGDMLYSIIYELLLSKLGLKPKFVGDRFKEKGWS